MNIISAYQSIKIPHTEIKAKSANGNFNLSVHEAKSLEHLCNILREYMYKLNTNDFKLFNGYYVGYSIKQISKEFDLLRFSNDLVINIELKGSLNDESKIGKIFSQMEQNYYYLKFLSKNIQIYTYVENDGLYNYNIEKKQPEKINICRVIENLSTQSVDYSINPDKLFIPSNYLISPFNNTDKFINHEFFLTDHQQEIKREIMNLIQKNYYKIYCISANAGTGKTLLVYDIAKTLIQHNKSPLIIHCGKLNNGHYRLINTNKWEVRSISAINFAFVDTWKSKNLDVIIIDEAQRIRCNQLEIIVNKSQELKIPIIFSYDSKQYLRLTEKKDIFDYIESSYKDISIEKYSLTNKIRTNKEMSSFIKNLFHIGSSKEYLNYDNITIEYFENADDVREYIRSLSKDEDWKAITYTSSQYKPEPLKEVSAICTTNAHDVIGQEFKKVVFVMDSNFFYNEQGRLMTKKNYYSGKGMLFQIVTRVIDELKIIVLDDSKLFFKLLEIKSFADD